MANSAFHEDQCKGFESIRYLDRDQLVMFVPSTNRYSPDHIEIVSAEEQKRLNLKPNPAAIRQRQPTHHRRENTPVQKTLPLIKPGMTLDEAVKKRKRAYFWASIPPYLAALGKALKDGFGAMALYALIAFQELKLTPALLNPWIGAGVFVLAIALFSISLGMEGKSLRQKILQYLSKKAGMDLTRDNVPLKPAIGLWDRFCVRTTLVAAKVLRVVAPATAAFCKFAAGMGSTAGCLLLVFSGAGLIASTALTGVLPWVFVGISAVVGVTLGGVSWSKEGLEFIKGAKKIEQRCRLRLDPNAVIKPEKKEAKLPLLLPGMTDEQAREKRKKARFWSSIPPFIAAAGRAMKDGFGAMTLYSLLAFQKLKMTSELLTPWVGFGVFFLAVSLFVVALGMEGKALRERLLKYASKKAGMDLSYDDTPLKPVRGAWNTTRVYLAIFTCKILRKMSPFTAAFCKGVSGVGSVAGCLLLALSGMGLVTTTALTGVIPFVVLGVSLVIGFTLGLVSRYKEGDDFVLESKKIESHFWARLDLNADLDNAVVVASAKVAAKTPSRRVSFSPDTTPQPSRRSSTPQKPAKASIAATPQALFSTQHIREKQLTDNLTAFFRQRGEQQSPQVTSSLRGHNPVSQPMATVSV